MVKKFDPLLPFGVHHIDPMFSKVNRQAPIVADLMLQSMELLKSQQQRNQTAQHVATSDTADEAESVSIDTYKSGCNPGVRLAFMSRLDSDTQEMEELQCIVQQFYECRVASLERYLAFCVMFHAMAKYSSHPWLKLPWDIARSQSNLRVATTASPIGASSDKNEELTKEQRNLALKFVGNLTGYECKF